MASEAIDALCAQLKKAWATGDVDKILCHYSDDCFAIYSDLPGCKSGKAQLREKMMHEMARTENLEIQMCDRVIGENVASEVGTFSGKVKGQDKVDTARYSVTYVKRGGKWLIKYDVNIMPTQ